MTEHITAATERATSLASMSLSCLFAANQTSAESCLSDLTGVFASKLALVCLFLAEEGVTGADCHGGSDGVEES